MTPCCTNCLHWDEESAEDNVEGLGVCSWRSNVQVIDGKAHVRVIRQRGDDSCHAFERKAVPMSGQVRTSNPFSATK